MPSLNSGLQSALHICLAGATCGCFAILLAHNPAKLAGLEERTLGELDDIQPLARVMLLAVYLLMVMPQVSWFVLSSFMFSFDYLSSYRLTTELKNQKRC